MRYYSSTAQATTLQSAITSSAASMSVVAATGFPASYPFTLVIDEDTAKEELVTVSAVSGTTVTLSERGADGTPAFAHDPGAAVRHVVSARDFREPQEHLNSTKAHGVTGDMVGTSDVQVLTNKDLSDPSNTFPAKYITATSTDVMKNKDLTDATNNFPSTLVTKAGTQVLKNKDLTDNSNSFPNSLARTSDLNPYAKTADYKPGAWQSFPFASGFANNDATAVAQYRIVGSSGGNYRVRLRGSVKPTSGNFPGTGSSVVGTLPAAACPTRPYFFIVAAQWGTGNIYNARVDVSTNGNIAITAPATQGWATLDGVEFDLD